MATASIDFTPPETPDQLRALVVSRFGQAVTQVDCSHAVSNGLFDPTKVLGGAIQTLSTAQLIAQRLASAAKDAAEAAQGQKAAQAQNQKVWGAVGTVFAAMATVAYGPAAGAVVAAAAAALGNLKAAAAGPGACATDPPLGSNWSQLRSWTHYTDPYSNYGIQQIAASGGSFEAWAYPILEYNAALSSNCYAFTLAQSPGALLTSVIQIWNAFHAGPSRTIKRGPPACNFGQKAIDAGPYDLIAYSMAAGNFADSVFPWDYNNGCAVQAPVSFSINNGPQIVPGSLASTSQGAASGATKALVYVGIATGVGAAGVGAYALATGMSFMGVLKGLWGASGGRLIAAVNPLPKPRRKHRRSTR